MGFVSFFTKAQQVQSWYNATEEKFTDTAMKIHSIQLGNLMDKKA